MKNLKRISVLILALMLCLSTVSFAKLDNATADKYTLEGVLSANSVKAGETVTLKLYIYTTEGEADVTLDRGADTAVTPSITYPINIFGEPTFEVISGGSYTPAFTDDGMGTEGYIDEAIKLASGGTFNKTTPIVTFTFTATADGDNLSELFYFYDVATTMNDAVSVIPKMFISVATPAPSGPKFDASGKATSGTVAGHDIVGGGKTEDRSYFADQFTLTGTTAETTILGIKTKFVPVYAAGADESKAVVKEYTINADEGIAGGAELKFNVVLIGAPADVTGVNISSEIVTK